jgi:anti-sigma B factor antagonist
MPTGPGFVRAGKRHFREGWWAMELATEELDGGVTRIILNGRLDIAGAGAVDLRFNTLAGSRRAVVVDLARVSFLASMGIRMLLTGAKTVQSKGGKMVLLDPEPGVEKALTMAGIDTVIPIHRDIDGAAAAVRA